MCQERKGHEQGADYEGVHHILIVVAAGAGFSYYTKQAAEAWDQCREELVNMELVHRKYGPTGPFTTGLHELTIPRTRLWRTAIIWPHLNDYTAEVNASDGTEHSGGLAAPFWSVGSPRRITHESAAQGG